MKNEEVFVLLYIHRKYINSEQNILVDQLMDMSKFFNMGLCLCKSCFPLALDDQLRIFTCVSHTFVTAVTRNSNVLSKFSVNRTKAQCCVYCCAIF